MQFVKKSEPLARREFLKFGSIACAAGAGSVIMPSLSQAALPLTDGGTFSVAFRNVHTGESFSGVYRVGNKYLPKSFEQINHVLRDFRTGDVFPIDPRLIDVVYTLQKRVGKQTHFEVLSGYRSPKTNAMLRRSSSGVARKSLHMSGKAIDLRLPGYSTWELRQNAVSLKAGGVGYYSNSDFIHVDTGRVRAW